MNSNIGLALIEAIKNRNPEEIDLLLGDVVDINFKSDSGGTALMYAASYGDVCTVKKLIDMDADLDIQGRFNYTALICALMNGHIEVIAELIKAKADLDLKDDEGHTALMGAVITKKFDIAKMLIKAKADLNVQDRKGDTILFYAISNNNKEMVENIIRAGADVNLKDFDLEQSPLMMAVRKDFHDIVQLLVDEGADLDLINKYGETAMDLAVVRGSQEIIQILSDGIEERAERDKSYKEQADHILSQNMSLQDMRAYKNDKGENALIILTIAGQFNKLAEKADAEAKDRLGLEDLIGLDDGCQKLVSILGKDQILKDAFNPKLWIDRPNEMVKVWHKVPVPFQDQVDIKDAIYDVKRLTLQKTLRRRGR